jgi:hypothetical protein
MKCKYKECLQLAVEHDSAVMNGMCRAHAMLTAWLVWSKSPEDNLVRVNMFDSIAHQDGIKVDEALKTPEWQGHLMAFMTQLLTTPPGQGR